MDKIIVKLYVPTLEKQFDIKIPADREISSIINLLNDAIYDLSNGEYDIIKKHLLFDRITGKQYCEKDSVMNTNIKNGKEIILM